MNPQSIRLLAVFLVLLITFCSGSYLGYHYADNACEARKGQAQEVAIEKHDEAADVGKSVEKENVQRTVKTEAVFNGIQQGVITYVQKHPASDDCHLDADGMRLWDAANANTDPQPARERDAGVRAATAPAGKFDDGSADQSYRGGSRISPVSGSAQRIGDLAGENK